MDLNEQTIRSLVNRGNPADKSETVFLFDRKGIKTVAPTLLSKYRMLKILSFVQNELYELCPTIFDSLLQLKELYLCNNHLTVLPSNLLKNNKKLEIVYVWGNELTEIDPQTFANLPELRKLCFCKNKVENFDFGSLKNSVKLTDLCFHGNNLSEINEVNKFRLLFPKLKICYFDGNNFSQLYLRLVIMSLELQNVTIKCMDKKSGIKRDSVYGLQCHPDTPNSADYLRRKVKSTEIKVDVDEENRCCKCDKLDKTKAKLQITSQLDLASLVKAENVKIAGTLQNYMKDEIEKVKKENEEAMTNLKQEMMELMLSKLEISQEFLHTELQTKVRECVASDESLPKLLEIRTKDNSLAIEGLVSDVKFLQDTQLDTRSVLYKLVDDEQKNNQIAIEKLTAELMNLQKEVDKLKENAISESIGDRLVEPPSKMSVDKSSAPLQTLVQKQNEKCYNLQEVNSRLSDLRKDSENLRKQIELTQRKQVGLSLYDEECF